MKFFIVSVLMMALAGCASPVSKPVEVTAVVGYVQPQSDTIARKTDPYIVGGFPLKSGENSIVAQSWSSDVVKCDSKNTGCKRTLIKVTVLFERVDVDATGVSVHGNFISDMGHRVEMHSGNFGETFSTGSVSIPDSEPVLAEGTVIVPFKRHLDFDEDLQLDGPYGSKAIIRISRKK